MNTLRDRTTEFFKAVEAHKAAAPRPQASRADAAAQGGSLQAHAAKQGRFAQAAGTVMHGIRCVSAKLEKLTELARQKSLFKDPTREIQHLRFVIKEDITKLSEDITALENFNAADGKGGHSQRHSTAVVKDLKIKLASTTRDFSSILEMRTKNLQAQASRRKRYGSSGGGQLRLRSVNSFGIDEGKGNKTHSQVMKQQQLESRASQDYLQSRAETVQDIEKMLGELGNIYGKLATIVANQEEVVISIDQKLAETQENVQNGVTELEKLYSSVRSNRWLIMKVFLVLIGFSVFFTVFVA